MSRSRPNPDAMAKPKILLNEFFDKLPTEIWQYLASNFLSFSAAAAFAFTCKRARYILGTQHWEAFVPNRHPPFPVMWCAPNKHILGERLQFLELLDLNLPNHYITRKNVVFINRKQSAEKIPNRPIWNFPFEDVFSVFWKADGCTPVWDLIHLVCRRQRLGPQFGPHVSVFNADYGVQKYDVWRGRGGTHPAQKMFMLYHGSHEARICGGRLILSTKLSLPIVWFPPSESHEQTQWLYGEALRDICHAFPGIICEHEGSCRPVFDLLPRTRLMKHFVSMLQDFAAQLEFGKQYQQRGGRLKQFGRWLGEWQRMLFTLDGPQDVMEERSAIRPTPMFANVACRRCPTEYWVMIDRMSDADNARFWAPGHRKKAKYMLTLRKFTNVGRGAPELSPEYQSLLNLEANEQKVFEMTDIGLHFYDCGSAIGDDR